MHSVQNEISWMMNTSHFHRTWKVLWKWDVLRRAYCRSSCFHSCHS